ncbi:MAG: Holliday junction resolvase RuvX [Propionibacteriaceae bacterium]|nr:Holliday junction resolvase RuvX [Propionibacteriaceae bacterium]
MLDRLGVLLAVDLGSARVGVAACDAGRVLAYPVETVPAGDGLDDRITALVAEYAAAALIVGFPLALDGSRGIAAQNVENQARLLAEKVGVPVWLVDERLTSVQANQRLRAAGRNSKSARGVVDAQAAVGILESVLHALEAGRMIGRELEVEEAHG